MNIILRPVGALKTYCQELLDEQGRIALEGCEGRTLATVCRDIGLPQGLVSLFIVNGHLQSDTYRLHRGDDVKCVALIGGG